MGGQGGLERFCAILSDLTVNSKPLINVLTKIARDNIHQADSIVRAADNCLKKAPSVVLLPILYLIDSIMKNVGEDYIRLFSSILSNSFPITYEKADKITRQSMYRLRQTWSKIIPSKVLCKIDVKVHAVDPAWLLSAESQYEFNTTPLKILVNPNFLPENVKSTGAEEDEADILRQELLKQMRKRDEEKQQQQRCVDLHSLQIVSDAAKLKILSDSGQSKNHSSTGSVPLEESSESQADSTTMVGLADILQKEKNEPEQSSNVYHKTANHDIPVNEQLIHIVSDLISTQRLNSRQPENSKAYRFAEQKSLYREHLKKVNDWSKYPEERSSRNYNSHGLQRSAIARHRYSRAKERTKYYNLKNIKGLDSEHHSSKDGKELCSRKEFSIKKIPFVSTPPLKRSNIFSSQVSSRHIGNECCNILLNHVKRKYDCRENEDESQSKAPFDIINRSSTNILTVTISEDDQAVIPPCAFSGMKKLPLLTSEQNLVLPKGPRFSPNPEPSCHIGANNIVGETRLTTLPHCSKERISPNPDVGILTLTVEKLMEIDHHHGYEGTKQIENFKFAPSSTNPTLEQLRENCSLPYPNSSILPPVERNSFVHDQGTYGELDCNVLSLSIQEQRHEKTAQFSSSSSRIPEVLQSTNSPVSLPPANKFILGKIAQDTMKTMPLDSVKREVRFYGEIAVIDAGESNPREISFKPGTAIVIVNNIPVHCAFQEPAKEVILHGKIYRVRFGAPTRELYINDEAFQCPFNLPPLSIRLSSGEALSVELRSDTTPMVLLGALRRDLVAGYVILSVDALCHIKIFLDAKPQRFDIAGIPHTLKFADALETILVNDQPVNLHFGGPSIIIIVSGMKHYVCISDLPRGLVPGQVNIVSMATFRKMPDNVQVTPIVEHLHPIETRNIEPYQTGCHPSKQTFLNSHKGKGKKRSRLSEKLRRRAQYLHYVGNKTQEMPNQWPWKSMLNGAELLPTLNEHGPNYSYPVTGTLNIQESPLGGVPALLANVNVHELFQNLCDVGLLVPPETSSVKHMLFQEVNDVDFKEPSSLRCKQPGILKTLHSGIQCNSCGDRFHPEHTDSYREHLDSHFHQNHSLKFLRKSQKRLWYCNRKTWIESDEVVSVEQEMKQSEGEEISSVPSHDFPPEVSCEVCAEKFLEYFNEDDDEWHLKDCMSREGIAYHPACFKDYQVSDTEFNSRMQLLEDAASNSGLSTAGTYKVAEECNENNLHHKHQQHKIKKDNADNQSLDEISAFQTQFQGKQLETDDAAEEFKEDHSTNKAKGTVIVKCKPIVTLSNEININTFDALIRKGNILESSRESEEIVKITSSTHPQVDTMSTDILSPYSNIVAVQKVHSNIAEVLDSSDLKSQYMERMIFKPKLIGRKLNQLPPAVKGCEASSLCCVS